MSEIYAASSRRYAVPVYEYACLNGHRFDRYLRLEDYAEPQVCECGADAHKRICAPMIQVDIPAYQSPIDGRCISSRAQRREDLARSGCVEYEPSMKEESARRRAAEDAALDRKVEEHVEREIYAMPATKREKLVAELEGGADVELTRI